MTDIVHFVNPGSRPQIPINHFHCIHLVFSISIFISVISVFKFGGFKPDYKSSRPTLYSAVPMYSTVPPLYNTCYGLHNTSFSHFNSLLILDIDLLIHSFGLSPVRFIFSLFEIMKSNLPSFLSYLFISILVRPFFLNLFSSEIFFFFHFSFSNFELPAFWKLFLLSQTQS